MTPGDPAPIEVPAAAPPERPPTAIEQARAEGRLTHTSRANPGDDGVVKVVVRVRIPGSESALLDALDVRSLSPEQRARVVDLLREAVPAALDSKHAKPEPAK